MATNTPPPAGLDEFIAAPASTTAPAAAGSAPEGLDDFIAPEVRSEKYGTLPEQLKTAAEGAASAATFGLSTGVEKALGVNPEDIKARREENPISHMLGQGAGLVASSALLPGGGAAGALTRAGTAVADAAGLAEAGIAAKAASQAAEVALFQGGDEISKRLADPNLTVGDALAHVGTAALIGGAFGGGLGLASKGISTVAEKSGVGKLVADFKGAVKDYIKNPKPLESVTDELSQYYTATKDAAEGVYGANGVKAKDLEKLMPEFDQKMATQAADNIAAVESSLSKLSKDPHAPLLQEELLKYKSALQSAEKPSDIFNAGQNFKKQLQEWGKYNKDLVPLGERAFRDSSRSLATGLKETLEDTGVWGKAAERQKAINKAFSEYLQPLKDFDSKFTTKLNGDRVIDPGKINTYLNQLGKPNAEIKQEMLKNFLKASEKYRSAIAESHTNLGLEVPFTETPLAAVHKTLGELTPGMRLAKAFIDKGIGNIVGSGIGGAAGAAVGHPVLGAIIGEHALSKYVDSALPALAKSMTEMPVSAEGMGAASKMAMAAIKGQKAIEAATDAVLKTGTGEALKVASVDKQDTEKLSKWVKDADQDPNKLLAAGTAVGHYMPEHGAYMTQKVATIHGYLMSQQPVAYKAGLLGNSVKPGKAQDAAYQRTLEIAQQPSVILKRLKDATLTLKDLQDINTMHPEALTNLRQSANRSISQAVSKGEVIPYKLRQGLSLFLGQPLDNTFEPSSIQGAQAVFAQKKEQQQQDSSIPPKSPTQSASKALGELSQNSRTPSQARALKRQTAQ